MLTWISPIGCGVSFWNCLWTLSAKGKFVSVQMSIPDSLTAASSDQHQLRDSNRPAPPSTRRRRSKHYNWNIFQSIWHESGTQKPYKLFICLCPWHEMLLYTTIDSMPTLTKLRFANRKLLLMKVNTWC